MTSICIYPNEDDWGLYRVQRGEATRCPQGRGTKEDTSLGKENCLSLDAEAAI